MLLELEICILHHGVFIDSLPFTSQQPIHHLQSCSVMWGSEQISGRGSKETFCKMDLKKKNIYKKTYVEQQTTCTVYPLSGIFCTLACETSNANEITAVQTDKVTNRITDRQ